MWIRTWNIPMYKEWARKKKGQDAYELLVVRQESKRYLLARAELVFGPEGLPEFRTLESLHVTTEREATRRILEWKKV